MLVLQILGTQRFSHLGDGHGDVEEFAPPSLRNGPREKQLQTIFGEKRLLVLNAREEEI